jgi:hypothetical protein
VSWGSGLQNDELRREARASFPHAAARASPNEERKNRAMAKAWPKHIRMTLWDDATGSIPIELPKRRMWPVGILFGVIFAIFATVEGVMIAKASLHSARDVFDLMMFLFDVFWIVGWSVGVLILGALTVLFLLYGESARLQGRHLVHVPRLGPLKIVCRYELERIHDLRAEDAKVHGTARVRFTYEGVGKGTTLGDRMPREEAEALVARLCDAGASTEPLKDTAPVTVPGKPLEAPPMLSLPVPRHEGVRASTVALIVANLLPLAGVLLLGWDLAAVMVLYWAESAVIGFYTVLKMCVVDKFGALFSVPFFIGHFGAFMAVHFAFVYGLFMHPDGQIPRDIGAYHELCAIFLPLWPALIALVVSHGISFFLNFIGNREYMGISMTALTAGPYKRIIVMHLTVILGGWIVLALGTPVPALLVLVVLKLIVDMRAHRREHRSVAVMRPPAAAPSPAPPTASSMH